MGCEGPQIYAWGSQFGPNWTFGPAAEPAQYCGDEQFYRSYPQVVGGPTCDAGGSPVPAVDAEGDWVSITFLKCDDRTMGLAVRSDGTLWTWGDSVPNDVHYLLAGTYGFRRGMVQIGSDNDWMECDGSLLLKQDGSLWSIGSNREGQLGVGNITKNFLYDDFMGPEFSTDVYARLSSSVASVELYGNAVFSSTPTVWIEARSRDTWRTDPLSIENGSGATLSATWGGSIKSINVTSSGAGFVEVPTISISPSVPQDQAQSATARVSGMVYVKTESFVVRAGGSGYTQATAYDTRTGARATAVIGPGGSILSWNVADNGYASTNALDKSLWTSKAYIAGDGQGCVTDCIPYPAGITSIAIDTDSGGWKSPPWVSISGNNGATAVVSSLAGKVKEVSVLTPGSGYSTAAFNFGDYDDFVACRDRVLFAVASDGVKTEIVGIVRLNPSPVAEIVPNFSYIRPEADGEAGVYFMRKGHASAYGWIQFGSTPSVGLAYGGDNYRVEPSAYIIQGGVPFPVKVSGKTWVSIDGSTSIDAGDFHWQSLRGSIVKLAVDSDGLLWWWGAGVPGSPTVPTRVGQGLAFDVDESVEFDGPWTGYTPGLGDLFQAIVTAPPPDSGAGITATALINAEISYQTYNRTTLQTTYKHRFYKTFKPYYVNSYSATSATLGIGYLSVPSTFDNDGMPISLRLVGPTQFTTVRRGFARDSDGRWWRIARSGMWSGIQPAFVREGTVTSSPFGNFEYTQYNLRSSSKGTPTALVPQLPGSGYSGVITIRYTASAYTQSVTQSVAPDGTITNHHFYIKTDVSKSRTFTATPGGLVPDFYIEDLDISSPTIEAATGSGGTLRVVSMSGFAGGTTFPPATIDIGCQPYAKPGEYFSGYYYLYNSYGYVNSAAFIDASGTPIRSTGYVDPMLSGAVAYDSQMMLCSDGRLVSFSTNGDYVYSDPLLGNTGQIEPKLTSTGYGYTDPLHVSVEQPPGVAQAYAHIDGKVVAIAATNGGSGYRVPPNISVDGPAEAQAVIQGPVDQVLVTSSGSGYRVPPIVRFSQPGLSAQAVCSLDANGGVSGVSISDGGTYRVAPFVSFEPVPDIDSISVTNAGSGYVTPPDVRIVSGTGAGEGATAYCVLNQNGGVIQVVITNRGSGYYDTPKVLFFGGGGTGATAEAVVSSPGSGASAIARINGSVIYARVTNQGSGYQTSPAVTVLDAKPVGAPEKAVLQSRILGKIDAISVTSGGSKYTIDSYGFEDGKVGFDDAMRYAAPRVINEWLAASGSPTLTATVSGGVVTAVSVSDQDNLFYNVPAITFSDTQAVRTDTVLTRKAVSVIGTPATNMTKNVANNYYIDLDSNTTLNAVGPLVGFGYVGYYAYGLMYSTPPVIVVEDPAGYGFSASPVLASDGRMSSLSVSSAGNGYTLDARLVVRGGRKYVWDNPATATAIVSQSGRVVSITITSQGGGYDGMNAEVVISGGGGTGATARVSQFSVKGSGYGVATVAITSGGSGYTSTPTITIVDRSAVSDSLLSSSDAVISPATPEYATLGVPQQRSLSSVERLPAGISGWSLLPHYEDGWVEHVYVENRENAGLRTYTQAPALELVGPVGSGATAQTELVKWTGVFCDGAAKRWITTS
jgi:hypothetical protein